MRDPHLALAEPLVSKADSYSARWCCQRLLLLPLLMGLGCVVLWNEGSKKNLEPATTMAWQPMQPTRTWQARQPMLPATSGRPMQVASAWQLMLPVKSGWTMPVTSAWQSVVTGEAKAAEAALPRSIAISAAPKFNAKRPTPSTSDDESSDEAPDKPAVSLTDLLLRAKSLVRDKKAGKGAGKAFRSVEKPAKRKTIRQRQDRKSQVRDKQNAFVRREATRQTLKKRGRKKKKDEEEVEEVTEVAIPDQITVGELASRMAVQPTGVVMQLMKMGVMASINQPIDAETAEKVVVEFGLTPLKDSGDILEEDLQEAATGDEEMFVRAPVVTVMGHVDHGKTSLLDAIRNADVTSGEAGGITQGIAAYQVQVPSGDKITFIDTPGHAAFAEMRARGANVTDLVVLVVAADDGIMEQTIESIKYAKAASVPMIVAINKVDKPDSDPNRVRNGLLAHNVMLEEFGGDVLSVEVSAKKGNDGGNIDGLLESIALQAEVLELEAARNRAAVGVVVEAKVEKGRGSVATVLIQRGTLKKGDIFVAGTEWGRVKQILDDRGQEIQEGLPAMPVEVFGLSGAPQPGDQLVVVETEARAREVTAQRIASRSAQISGASLVGSQDGVRDLPVVIKSDVQGSSEAIVSSLNQFATSEVAVRVLHTGVGEISEGDVTMAMATKGLIVGFNVRANKRAKDLADKEGIDIRYYSIIYDVIDDAQQLITGLLPPKEVFLGYAEILDIFQIARIGKVAGCKITEGVVRRGCKVRLLRKNVVIHEGSLKTLKRMKDEVGEVEEGLECGMAFEDYDEIEKGDMIECSELQAQTAVAPAPAPV